MRFSWLSLGLIGLAAQSAADPTWPSSVDELEEIMFQVTSFRARKFADTVSPCTNEASGPGRQNAAEWLRVAFHDMSTANTFFGTGGLDASLQYELDNGENTGPGHRTTLDFMGPFVSTRASLSDLIAMGVYFSVRSCGGPIVPIRAGRIDATGKGNTGVPQPQNSVLTFQQQFERMNFTTEEMIQVTACGHTLGGVHTTEFPDLVPAGTFPNDEGPLDSTVAAFDNKVVTEYLAGTTTNPLVVGPSVKIGKNSDFKVFNSDGNVTMKALADATNFQNVCKTVLQKMIDIVPPEVQLTAPILPYMVKPVNLQLTLANGGAILLFSGFIRIKTTDLPTESITDLTITYKNRQGESDCGGSCNIKASLQGVSQGFDDTFAFFPINANIPAATGISSFIVTINKADGTTTIFDNNAQEYPMQDAIVFQKPQSCLLGSTGALTLMAAVRNDRASNGATASISYKVPQDTSPVPLLKNATVQLQKGQCAGEYTLFTAKHTIDGGLPYESYIDVINGDKSDSFKSATDLGGTCREFDNAQECDGGPDPSTDSSTATATKTSATVTDGSSTVTTSNAGPTETLHHRQTVGGYNLVSCWTEGNGARALGGPVQANDNMTLSICMDFCKEYVYWGTEYGRECYCGNSLAKSSEEAPLTECNMVCGGDPSEYCGAGSRLELYSTTASQPSTTSTTPTPTVTPVHQQTVGNYSLVGCWTEGQGTRALKQGASQAANMTNEICAESCKKFRYFGTEFGDECYCGSFLDASSNTTELGNCNLPCGGDKAAFCGGSNTLELYMNPNITGGNPEQPAAAGNFVFLGCQTEVLNGTRALPGSTTASDDMTNEVCAEFCDDFEYFGTEFGRECYCGNAISEKSKEAASSACNQLCAGDDLEYCGAPNILSIYTQKEDPTDPDV